MDTVQTRATVNMSVKVKDHVKAELQHIAKAENRSVHYVMLEAIDHYITAKKAEAEHQAWIKEQVLQAYDRFKTEGSNGLPMADAHQTVMANIRKQYAQ